jgi:hypothetical protein
MSESSIDLINLKLAFGLFDPVRSRDAEAMHLLQECVRLKCSPPDFLLPYVGKAVEAWGNTKGNKIAFKDIKGEWDYLIWLVHFYHIKGATIDAAIKEVVEWNPEVGGKNVTFITLERYYGNSSSQHIKDDVEEKFGSRMK